MPSTRTRTITSTRNPARTPSWFGLRAASRRATADRRDAFVTFLVACLTGTPARAARARVELARLGVDPAVVEAVERRRYRDLGRRDAAIAAYVHRATLDPASLVLEDIDDLRTAGLADHEILWIDHLVHATRPTAVVVRRPRSAPELLPVVMSASTSSRNDRAGSVATG